MLKVVRPVVEALESLRKRRRVRSGDAFGNVSVAVPPGCLDRAWWLQRKTKVREIVPCTTIID